MKTSRSTGYIYCTCSLPPSHYHGLGCCEKVEPPVLLLLLLLMLKVLYVAVAVDIVCLSLMLLLLSPLVVVVGVVDC